MSKQRKLILELPKPDVDKIFNTAFGRGIAEVIAEKQHRIDLLEEEIRRLWQFANDLKNGQRPLCLAFEDSFLSSICDMMSMDFRPLTDEEKEAQMIEIKNAISQVRNKQ